MIFSETACGLTLPSDKKRLPTLPCSSRFANVCVFRPFPFSFRVSMYSGYRLVSFPFAYGAFTLSGRLSQNLSARITESIMRSEPRCARTTVWPLSISLAATLEIDVSFSSSGYLDVSVHRVPFHTLWIGVWMTGVLPAGFPHSDICGSKIICISPQLFAAYHVFLRLLVPRHPPCALFCLIIQSSLS